MSSAALLLTDQQVRDECVTLFLAGHETTALALAHALYLVATHPEIEARFHDEVTEVLGPPEAARAPQALPASDAVARLPLTRRILDEAMRLYPPAWSIAREVQRPFELRGRRLAPGALISARAPLAELPAAFERLHDRPDEIKILIDPRS